MAEVIRITEWYFLCKALKKQSNLGPYYAPMAG